MFTFENKPDHIVSGYRCGACWDVLVIHSAEGRRYSVKCVNCGENVPGFVSAYYVERRQHESLNQFRQARQAMIDAWPHLFPKLRPPAKLLQELGF